MKRREFISLLGGAAAVWPLALQAQQRERVRRIGVLIHLAADDPDGQSRLAAFLQGLQERGWAVGSNVAVEVRWAAADVEAMTRFAKELVAHQPDLLFVQRYHGLQEPRARQARAGRPQMAAERTLADRGDRARLLCARAVIPGPESGIKPIICR